MANDLADTLEALRQDLVRLSDRVATLERQIGAPPAGAPAPAVAASPSAEAISEELVLVLAAAAAAFLGKKPHIRQIRLIGSAAWSQEGRLTIQTSHAL
jgi:methylmalonyl-CoA carboxyltransferase large subunit